MLVGRREDVGTALARRGYRWGKREEDARQLLLGRPPDFVLRKWSQAGTPGNWLRIWTLPMTFQGRPVLVAQTGAPRGGRFARKLVSPTDDPAVDHIRDLLVQEMLYSDGLAKLAIMPREQVAEKFADVTDGLIAVLFVAARRVEPNEVLVADWREVEWDLEPAPYSARQ